jgi:hypothetical protein
VQEPAEQSNGCFRRSTEGEAEVSRVTIMRDIGKHSRQLQVPICSHSDCRGYVVKAGEAHHDTSRAEMLSFATIQQLRAYALQRGPRRGVKDHAGLGEMGEGAKWHPMQKGRQGGNGFLRSPIRMSAGVGGHPGLKKVRARARPKTIEATAAGWGIGDGESVRLIWTACRRRTDWQSDGFPGISATPYVVSGGCSLLYYRRPDL